MRGSLDEGSEGARLVALTRDAPVEADRVESRDPSRDPVELSYRICKSSGDRGDPLFGATLKSVVEDFNDDTVSVVRCRGSCACLKGLMMSRFRSKLCEPDFRPFKPTPPPFDTMKLLQCSNSNDRTATSSQACDIKLQLGINDFLRDLSTLSASRITS